MFHYCPLPLKFWYQCYIPFIKILRKCPFFFYALKPLSGIVSLCSLPSWLCSLVSGLGLFGGGSYLITFSISSTFVGLFKLSLLGLILVNYIF